MMDEERPMKFGKGYFCPIVLGQALLSRYRILSWGKAPHDATPPSKMQTSTTPPKIGQFLCQLYQYHRGFIVFTVIQI
jgi:hypothetical protein